MAYPDTAEIKKILSSEKEPDWETIINKIIRPLSIDEDHGGISYITFDFFCDTEDIKCRIVSTGGWLKKPNDKINDSGNYRIFAIADNAKAALLAAIKKIYIG